MSDEDRDAITGRAMRESKENDERIEKLFGECSRVGKRLEDIAYGLKTHPEGVALESQSMDTRYIKVRVAFLPSDFDLEKLTKLTADYREALTRREQYDIQLEALGFPNRRSHAG